MTPEEVLTKPVTPEELRAKFNQEDLEHRESLFLFRRNMTRRQRKEWRTKSPRSAARKSEWKRLKFNRFRHVSRAIAFSIYETLTQPSFTRMVLPAKVLE